MKKALKITFSIVLVLCSIAYVLCYIFLKEQTTYFTECVIDFINRPLPIIGVSLLVVLIFVYKIVVATRFGKQALAKYQNELNNTQRELEEYKLSIKEEIALYEAKIEAYKQYGEQVKDYFVEFCELSHNVKVKQLGEKIKESAYEETIKCDTKEE